MTEAQAADYLQLTERQLVEERRRGRIVPFRIVGNRIRYTREQLDEYVRNHPLNSRRNGSDDS